MKKLSLLTVFISLLLGVSSCLQEDFEVKEGNLYLKLESAGETLLPYGRTTNATDDFMITIAQDPTGDSTIIVDSKRYAALGNKIMLSPGNYGISIIYGTDVVLAFAAPYYSHYEEFEILEGELTILDIEVLLKNSKLMVNYSNNVKGLVPTIITTLKIDTDSLIFDIDTKQAAYFKPAPVSLIVKSSPNAEEDWFVLPLSAPQANDFFNVTFDMNDDGTEMNISIGNENEIIEDHVLPIVDGLPTNPGGGWDPDVPWKGDVVLENQNEVIEFGNSGVTMIEGNLTLGKYNSDGITDYTPLNKLRYVSGNLTITYNEAESLEGLHNITHVTNLSFTYSKAISNIKNLKGLRGLEQVEGNINIQNNYGLQTTEGLENIELFNGNISITSNYDLQTAVINGQFSEITNFYIDNNTSLSLIEVGNSIKKINGSYRIHSNESLIDIKGFSNLESIVYNFQIYSNNKLQNIEGFNALIKASSTFDIYSNPNLTSINAFPSLSEGTYFRVYNNDKLENFCTINKTYFEGVNDSYYKVEGNAHNPTRFALISGSCAP